MKIPKYQTTNNRLTRWLLQKHGCDVDVLCTVGFGGSQARSKKWERERKQE